VFYLSISHLKDALSDLWQKALA